MTNLQCDYEARANDTFHNLFHCYVCGRDCSSNEWEHFFSVCQPCAYQLFPFTQNETNNDLSSNNSAPPEYDRLSDLRFNPFVAHENLAGNSDVDPDFQFYNGNSNESQYYHPKRFNETFETTAREKTFSSIHFNARSLSRNIDSIKLFLSSIHFNFDVIAMSETWLKEDNPLLPILRTTHLFVNIEKPKVEEV